MSRLVEFPLESGGSIVVQSSESATANVTTRGWRDDNPEETADRVEQSFEAAVARIRPATDALLNSLVNQVQTPEEVTLEFAVELSAHAGAVIATLGSTANFKITMTWRSDHKPDGHQPGVP